MEPNRDVRRQNKAATVVDATIYSFMTDDAAKSIKSITSPLQSESSNPTTTIQRSCSCCTLNKRKIADISKLALSIIESNEQQRTKFMKCIYNL